MPDKERRGRLEGLGTAQKRTTSWSRGHSREGLHCYWGAIQDITATSGGYSAGRVDHRHPWWPTRSISAVHSMIGMGPKSDSRQLKSPCWGTRSCSSHDPPRESGCGTCGEAKVPDSRQNKMALLILYAENIRDIIIELFSIWNVTTSIVDQFAGILSNAFDTT